MKDVKLTGLRQKVFMDRYAMKDDDGKAVEDSPSQMWDRIARAVASVEEEERQEPWKASFRGLLEDFRFVPGGRILAGAGTGHSVTYYNCYVIPSPHDSREGIIGTIGRMVEIASRGGGVGINWSTLRPRGAYVKGVNGTSSGPVSWMQAADAAGAQVQQGGSRRCALMFMMDDWHPDVVEFIRVKEDLSKIHNANLSVCVSDRFMEAVAADADWELVFPDTDHPEYDTHWDGDIEAWRSEGRPVEVFETVPARVIWDQICESAWKSGEPGVVFMERYNKESNSWYFARIVSTNPCVTGDTLIYTQEGLRRAEELFVDGRPVAAVSDGRRSEEPYLQASPVYPTGRKPVCRLTTKEGYELRLTADHRVMTDRGWVEARRLEDGDRIHVLNRPGGFGSDGSYELGLALGWLVSDGTLKEGAAVPSFWHEDRELVPLMGQALDQATRASLNGRAYHHQGTAVAERREARLESARLRELAAYYGLTEEKHRVPKIIFTGSEEAQRGFLTALFSGDGTVNAVASGQRNSVRLSSVSWSLLQDVQRLLLNFGIFSRIYRERKPAGSTLLPDGRGGTRAYESQAYHDLVITRQSMARFAEAIGFLQERKQEVLGAALEGYVRGPYRDDFRATFTGLVPEGEELVYDLTEPRTHAFVANGLVVHNCGEQGLPAWGVCNLGALNLTRFVADGEFQWDELVEAVPVAVRFLDNIIDETPYHFEENAKQQLGERRVGLGTMGLADTLLKLGVTYGSEESLELIERIYATIRDAAYRTSVELAQEKGPFPFCEPEKLLQSGFAERLPKEIRAGMAEHGLRNVTLITQAPTGSTSLLAGVSSGIEPVFAYEYMRRDRIGVHMVLHPAAEEWLEEQGIAYEPDDEEQNLLDLLPDHFVTAADLTPEEHARVQAVIQKFTDSSISKTVNAPNDHTVDEVKTLYRLAYEWGCKGVTYFRDGCREGVLTRTDSKSDKERAPAGPATNGEWGHIGPLDRPDRLDGITVGKKTPLGNLYVTVNSMDGHPFEVFATIGRAGSDVGAFTEAIARLISLCFRCGVDPAEVADELTGIGGSRSVGFGPTRVRSVPDAIGQVIHEYLREGGPERSDTGGAGPAADPEPAGAGEERAEARGGKAQAPAQSGGGGHGSATQSGGPETAAAAAREETATMVLTMGNGNPAENGGHRTMRFHLCPDCGIHAMIYVEGCAKCMACGHSEC